MFGLPAWVSAIIGAAAAPVIGQLFLILLPNKGVRTVGYAGGKFLTVFFRQKIGKSWEPVEKKAQGTISALLQGFHDGLDFDD